MFSENKGSQGKLTLKEAIKSCNAANDELAVIHDQETNTFLAENSPPRFYIFAGILIKGTESIKWSNGEEWTGFKNFKTTIDLKSQEKVCMVLYGTNTNPNLGKWGMDDCETPRNYICQRGKGKKKHKT